MTRERASIPAVDRPRFLLFALRMVQGLCLGGEYAGGDSLRRRHVSGERLRLLYRLATSLLRRWEIVVVAVVLGTRGYFGEDVFNAWAWRVPFPVSFLPCNLRADSPGDQSQRTDDQ
jgi:MFS family permease